MRNESTIGLLELRLGACLTGPTKAMLADLEAVAHACNRSRTAMTRAWERWCEDNNWTRHPALDKEGNAKFTKNGKPIYANNPLPEKMGDVTGSTWLYHKGRAVSPEVSSTLVNHLSQEVWDRLRSNVPYNHVGKAYYRWEGILFNEMARDCYRNLAVPMPSRDCIFALQGELSKEPSKKIAAELRRMSISNSLVRIPLYSNSSGRERKAIICRLETRQLSKGNRRVLLKIACGEWQMRDSKIVKKRNRIWCFQLTYHQPLRDHQLTVSNEVVLTCHQGGNHPFSVMRQLPTSTAASDEKFKSWTLGNAGVLREQYKRIDLRRRALKGDYRVAGSGVKGHGKQRFFRDISKVTRQGQNLMERFAKLAVSDAIKYCLRYDCGTMIYHEPGPNSRRHYWFDENGIPFDWTRFLAELTHKCHLNQIVLKVERPKKKEDETRATAAV